MNIRNSLAIILCKALITVGKLMGKKGSSAPGGIAMKVAPGLLRHLSDQVKGEIIAVCGTNGKTTTNNLLCDLLLSKGKNVVCNNVGANMLQGVACSFISKADIFGRLNCDYAAIECDEASLRHVVKHVTPDKIVITNMFQDQLDRYGEVEMTAALLNEAIEKVPDATLILNADDPVSMLFSKHKNCVFYGIDHRTIPGEYDKQLCIHCGSELDYSVRYYSQLGHYKCPNCDFARPESNYTAENVSLSDGIAFDVKYGNEVTKLALNYRGFYNIYNVLASFCAFELTGLGTDGINDVYNSYKPQIGRMETFNIGGKTVILNLFKNPAGFNQSIAAVMQDERSKDVLISLNDNPSDGRDVSWIWDSNFEQLSHANVNSITCSGMRRYDLALRVKYASLGDALTADINPENIKKIISQSGEVCYMLVNYTALFSTQNILKELEG